jgi:hypothetical protein
MEHSQLIRTLYSRRGFGKALGAAALAPALARVPGIAGTTRVARADSAALAQPAAPVLAWYYPQFSQGAAADVASAQRGGIDALVVSQTGHEPGQPLERAEVVRAAEGTGQLFAIGFEPQMYPNQTALVNELRRILSQDAAHPRYLWYWGRPVVIFWALQTVPLEPGQSPQAAWRSIRDQVDPGRNSIWIAEGGDASASGTVTYLSAFDGLHLYSVAWDADPGRALSGWARRVRQHDPSSLWVATVMPGGYYGTGSDPSKWSYRDRLSGGYYRQAWQGAMATSPNMVIITSFNETKERTEIHPTGEWGDLYLDLNRQLGDQWRGALGAAPFQG